MKTDALFSSSCAIMKTAVRPFSGGSASEKTADVVSKRLVAVMNTACAVFKWPVSGIKRRMPISGGEGPA
jgi:hypothetical protein